MRRANLGLRLEKDWHYGEPESPPANFIVRTKEGASFRDNCQESFASLASSSVIVRLF
jgi:hypothetical protein